MAWAGGGAPSGFGAGATEKALNKPLTIRRPNWNKNYENDTIKPNYMYYQMLYVSLQKKKRLYFYQFI